MREKDIHKLIEQENPEVKQRMWEKICAQIDLEEAQPQQTIAAKTVKKNNLWKWITATVAVIVVVTLSIVLPIVLKDDGMRYCDFEQYTIELLDQTLGEYFSEHNEKLLYVDLYDVALERITEHGYNKDNKNDTIYFTETLSIFNKETLETITLSVTDNKTRVDIFAEYYNSSAVVHTNIKGVSIQWIIYEDYPMAMFEYQKHIYYLQLNGGDQARLTQIIENMLK